MRSRLLISYYYFKGVDVRQMLRDHFTEPPDLFADSGAFSAFTQRDTVDVHAYADWLLKYEYLFTVYATLDVKHSWRQGLENQRILEGRGLRPLPIYHIGEPWELLDDLVSEYPYLGLGGIGVDHEAALDDVGGARDVGERGGHQPAGAGLGCRELETGRTARGEHALGQRQRHSTNR